MTPLIIIGCYLLVLVGFGVWSGRQSKGTSADYMLASHSIGPFLLLMSLFGTTMTAFALVGSTGEAFKRGIGVYGLMASSSGIVHSLCFFVLGVKLWSLGQKYGYRTQIQFFRDRLESNGIGLLLFPILIGLIIPYILIGVLGGGAVLSKVSIGAFPEQFPESSGGVPPWLGSLVILLIVLIYVFLGGMRGTAWVNAFQTAVFMVLGIVTFFVIANKLGGQDSLMANLQEMTRQVQQHHPEKLTRTDLSKLYFLSYILIPLSAGMFPHLFQHWLTAKSADSFKLSVVVHPLFIMIVWTPCVLIGVWATSAMVDGKPLIPYNFNPNAVLAFLVAELSGSMLSGFLSAGILAAIMSSLDSQFLCMGTMFTEDIVRHYIGKERVSEKNIILIARLFIIAIVVLTFLCSLSNPVSVFTLGTWCFSGFAALVPLLFMALYWRRLTAAGAYAGVIAMTVTWLYFFQQANFAKNGDYKFLGMLPVVTILVCSTIATIGVSLITRPPSEETLARFFPADASAASTQS